MQGVGLVAVLSVQVVVLLLVLTNVGIPRPGSSTVTCLQQQQRACFAPQHVDSKCCQAGVVELVCKVAQQQSLLGQGPDSRCHDRAGFMPKAV
jgi:hypothetical protein